VADLRKQIFDIPDPGREPEARNNGATWTVNHLSKPSAIPREKKMPTHRRFAVLAFAAITLGLASPVASAADSAESLLRRASAAMGADQLRTLSFSGSGTGATFGQAYKPGAAWPKLNYSNFARAVDYENAALREEFARSRGEPTGGGAVPLAGEQRLTTFVNGNYAWNVAGPVPAPSPVALTGRMHDLWTTPHGVIKAALRNKATVRWQPQGGKEVALVSFTEPGRFSAVVTLDDNHLVSKVDARVPSTVLGDTSVVTMYSDYRDYNGVKFPSRILQTAGGFPVLDLAVKDVRPNAPVEMMIPDTVRAAAERVTSEKAAEGVWYLAGGTHHSVAIEMKDHMFVVESPLYDGRAAAMLEAAGKLVPGKPVRYVVNSHPHFDHAGGLRTAVAHGATLVVHAEAKPYFERAMANPNRIQPDLLAKSGKKARVIGVSGKRVFSDGTRNVEVHAIKDSVHASAFLMVYLPAEKLLIEADAFTPPAPNTPPPKPANANNVNLADNITRLNLAVERILPLHGRIVPLAELHRVIGR
jgi:glyoxylase-like metal-dependent hydrolase (beta-lactamase superfamily II)